MVQTVHSPQLRLAQHYLDKLRHAEKATRWGRQNQNRMHHLDQIQHDWAQIAHWQAWSAAGSEDDPERARLCLAFPLATSRVLRLRQLPEETLVWSLAALDAAVRLGDGKAERYLLYLICTLYGTLEDFDAIERMADRLAASARAADDQSSMGFAYMQWSRVQEFRGNLTEAESLMLHAVELLEPRHTVEDLGLAWQILGRLAIARGDYERSYAFHIKLLEGAKAEGMHGAVAVAHLSLSGLALYMGDYAAAEDHARKSLAVGRQIGFTRFIPSALAGLAHAEKRLGRLETACDHYQEALATRSMLPPSTLINVLYGFGQARVMQGDLEAAFALFDEARTLARERKIAFRLCEVLPDLVVLYLVRNESDQAGECLRELVTTVQTLDSPKAVAAAFGSALIYAAHVGKAAQAAEYAGILSALAQNLDPLWFDAAIFDALKDTLGDQAYHAAFERGRALDPAAALNSVFAIAL